MNWLTNVVRPKIRNILRRETPENLWIKCPDSGQLVFYKDVEANQFVIPGSNYHMRMGAVARLKSIFDNETWYDIALPEVTADPLKFRDERKYADRIKDARARTGLNDAIKVGYGKLEGAGVVIAVQDFDFMGGSLGMAAGEAIVRGLELAVEKKSPFIVFAASGGARMQEGILSLMQMPRTTVGVQMLREAKQPYIVVLTNPTTGGVTASYAMLGDVQIAEPGALIGFAGARVIEQTIREKLPEGFQRAEYLNDHGMVDMVVHRHELRPTLARLCRLLTKSPALETAVEARDRRSSTRPRSPRLRMWRRPHPRRERTSGQTRSAARRIDRAAVGAASRSHRSQPRSACSCCWQRLDHPERELPPVIHVAGTNGKGSTIAYLRAILEAASLRVHAYTSPYLVRLNECFRLGRAGGGALVGDEELRAALEHCERANAGAPITLFEIETAAAFCLFAQHPADVVLLEVGLGGRLDATNVIDAPLATVIAPVSMDHTEFLGDTLTTIAGEKAAHHQAQRAGDLRRASAGGRRHHRGAGEADARAAVCRRAGMARQCRARTAGLSGRTRLDGSGGAETVRPASVRQCRPRHRDAARAGRFQDRHRGVRGRHRRRRMAGADAAAGVGRAGGPGAAGLRDLARRRAQCRGRPRRRRSARRSRGAGVASAGGHRRHDGQQGCRRAFSPISPGSPAISSRCRYRIATTRCRRTGWRTPPARSACAWKRRAASKPPCARWRGSPTRCRRAS